jgi:hypothetical protein
MPSVSDFTRGSLDRLTGRARQTWLRDLRAVVGSRLEEVTTRDEFFECAGRIVAELKAAGHDLCSWGYDGETVESWGGDYLRPDPAGCLLLEFDWPNGVRLRWQQWRSAEPSAAADPAGI